jgi:epoxyqueuosine reductase
MKKLLHLDESYLSKLGVVDWGYTEEATPVSFDKYESWVEEGHHGPLSYLSDHRKDLRKSLESVNENFQSAVVFLFSYASEKAALESFYKSKESNGFKIAGYSLAFGGGDYHYELRKRLVEIGDELGGEFKVSLDIQPVLERDLAYRSGLGWFGKNSMLIHDKKGSFNMIGALLFDKKLGAQFNQVQTDHCGQCTACIDACPTDAIDIEKRQVIASKCISTFTIELFKDAEPPKGYENTTEIFGCDICQDVCPWNLRMLREGEVNPISPWPEARAEEIVNFFLRPSLSQLINNISELSGRGFQRLFKGTSFERTGKIGFLKNLKYRE